MNELAARIVAIPEAELAKGSDLSLTLQVDCQAEGYWPGDLFIQVLRLAERAGDQRQAMRLSVLRGELRAMVTADCGATPTVIDAGKALSVDRVKRGAVEIGNGLHHAEATGGDQGEAKPIVGDAAS